ncbi:hypothetical protein E6Q11_06455 [Candidatus Dojkabacteria bacterium]|uniref:Uncharacterized protein n=1 Tax=Candidatus Dojkabacteria bacterium TaxID=2099670 RepID=A0A5C7J2X9_9BACT|nr:MAG: hypothetical protein E6Q11_06455 [Candidatus Dojkabacteria bacterium]
MQVFRNNNIEKIFANLEKWLDDMEFASEFDGGEDLSDLIQRLKKAVAYVVKRRKRYGKRD